MMRRHRKPGAWMAFRYRNVKRLIGVIFLTVVGAFFVSNGAGAAIPASPGTLVVGPFTVKSGVPDRQLASRIVANAMRDKLMEFQRFAGRSSGGRPKSGMLAAEILTVEARTGAAPSHLGGFVVAAQPHGLRLELRVPGLPARSFTDEQSDLRALAWKAAEGVYSQAYPSSFVIYLLRHGRSAEAPSFAQAALGTASASEIPILLLHYGVALGVLNQDPLKQAALYKQAIAVQPDLWPAYDNLMQVDILLGQEEQAWRVGQEMQSRSQRSGRAIAGNYGETLGWLTRNYQASLSRIVADEKAHTSSFDTAENALGAVIATLLHDDGQARAQLALPPQPVADATVAAARHFTDGERALWAGDRVGATKQMEAFGRDFTDPTVASNFADLRCWIAPAEELTGRRAQADVVLNGNTGFVDCARFHADILDGRGDWPGAQRAYAAAMALAPDLPAAYFGWGQALARHGDRAGAATAFAAAHARGPHWAEPLKAWGDLLAEQSQFSGALAKYDEALTYAPAWRAVTRARERAASERAGR